MVWLLVPQHPSLGPTKYYFTAPGIYSVGRKDCTIIIQTDRTVSRLHAEIKLDLAIRSGDCTDFPRERITLKDLSKFGSFVNRSVDSKPVFSLSNKEISLNEGDILTFGTDSSSFRLEYFSIHLYITPIDDRTKKDSIVNAITSIGGCILDKWCAECTHLIVEDGTHVTDVVIQAVAEKKPVVGTAWIEAIAARNTVSEFPDYTGFTPNLLWKIDGDAKSLKIIETDARGLVFKGFTLYFGSMYLYNCKDVLKRLIDVSGGTYASVTSVSRSRVSQTSQHEANQLLILPAMEPQLQRWMNQEELRSISHIKRTSEEKFIAAVLSGNFKEEYYEVAASSLVSSSSDETLEASPSDDHDDDVNSSIQTTGPISFTCKGVIPNTGENLRSSLVTNKGIRNVNVSPPQAKMSGIIQNDLSTGNNIARYALKHTNGAAFSIKPLPVSVEKFKEVQKSSISVSNCSDIKLEDVGDSKADIEYDKDLIVRGYMESMGGSVPDSSLINFKKFRKKHHTSGNSFTTLVPFGKDPYRESEYNKEVQEHMQQEKKRQRTEALAEDLFNAEQLKRKKGVGVSLLSALHGGRLNVK